ncbi:MAG: ATP-binding protein [Gammaproteobacteria bacterium]|nr:ATP-binding protein [Gammaproteobacteria bacterium]
MKQTAQLKQQAQQTLHSGDEQSATELLPMQAQQLQDAFGAFNQLSAQLSDSYQQLEVRVAGLTEALETEQDERIKELTEKERVASRLASLLHALPGGVVVIDDEGKVQEHNPAAELLLGQPLLGLPWSDIIQRAFSPRSDDGHDISLVDGRKVNISTCPLGSEPGQILLITDVTEIRYLQDRMGQQQRLAAMGKMAASLAHQIRTPLSSALLYVSNLKRQVLSDEDRFVLTEKMTSRLRHLEQLIEDMLMYSKEGKVGEECFTSQTLLDELYLGLEPQLELTQTRFVSTNSNRDLIIQGNRQMLLSALSNLAMNAMQAMKESEKTQMGKIEVSITKNNNDVCISIKDNGPGIPSELQEQIFDPFYTTRTQGTGLGLAVVQAVAKAHGGLVELVSNPKNGSEFKLTMPLEHKNINQFETAEIKHQQIA